MKAFISHQSALEYWRTHRVLPYRSAQQRHRISLPDKAPTKEIIGLTGLKLPVHIMLRELSARRVSKLMVKHVFTGQTPNGSFISIRDALYVSSPEFCFLQMANVLPLATLIELGFELCGSYSMPVVRNSNLHEKGFYKREPLTNAKKLEAFAVRMAGVKGHQKAMRALSYVIDGSASPMETKLTIILILPYLLGGFGFEKPVLNKRFVPSKINDRSSYKTSYSCDLYWPDHSLALEYDSAFYHSGQTQIYEDSKKRTALKTMGVEVMTVTKQQIFDKKDFEQFARALAKSLGKRLAYKNPNFTKAYIKLREQLELSFDEMLE